MPVLAWSGDAGTKGGWSIVKVCASDTFDVWNLESILESWFLFILAAIVFDCDPIATHLILHPIA